MNLEEMNDEQIEVEALKQGFNPNFDGDNKKTPKEFLEVAFNHNHVLKERNEKLSTEVDDIKAELKKQHSLTQKLVEFQEEQKQKAVSKAIRELEVQKKDAILEGDPDKVELIDKEIDEHKEEVAKSSGNPILDAWIDNNQWYLNDEEMGIEADLIAKQLKDTGRFPATDAGYEKLVTAMEKKVKKAFPEKFENPKKDLPPEVSGGRPSPTRNSKKSYEDLPSDAKQACDEFVSGGIFKSRDEYVANYEWE